MKYEKIIDIDREYFNNSDEVVKTLTEFLDELYKSIEITEVGSPTFFIEEGEVGAVKSLKINCKSGLNYIPEMVEEVKKAAGLKGIYLYKVGAIPLQNNEIAFYIRLLNKEK